MTFCIFFFGYIGWVWITLKNGKSMRLAFFVSSVHYSQDLQVRKNANVKLKLDPTILFTHLKIILL